MKKLIVLLSMILVLITGCSIIRLDDTDISNNLDKLLSKKVKLYNVYNEGYKYYIPKGIRFVDKDEYNAIIRDQNDNKYYLYVDVIGYYHRIPNEYKVKKDMYYSKKLNYSKKTGYLQIEEIDKKYFVQYVYNYMKIEAYLEKSDLIPALNNMSSILRTVKFNDAILESLIGENILDYKEEDYTLFNADSNKESFLDVVEREETDRYKKDIEDEKIELED